MEAQRNSRFIEVSVEPRRLFESADIKLIRVFHRNFGFIGIGLVITRGSVSYFSDAI